MDLGSVICNHDVSLRRNDLAGDTFESLPCMPNLCHKELHMSACLIYVLFQRRTCCSLQPWCNRVSNLSYCAIPCPPWCHPETHPWSQKSCQHLLQWAVLVACYVADLCLWVLHEQQEVLAPLHTCAACHNMIGSALQCSHQTKCTPTACHLRPMMLAVPEQQHTLLNPYQHSHAWCAVGSHTTCNANCWFTDDM